ncbi:MAG TPA: hypothetical protein VK738_06030 [Terriglobales bacterium]|nr:hypothetical protein [Terriglobales bacterium]
MTRTFTGITPFALMLPPSDEAVCHGCMRLRLAGAATKHDIERHCTYLEKVEIGEKRGRGLPLFRGSRRAGLAMF